MRVANWSLCLGFRLETIVRVNTGLVVTPSQDDRIDKYSICGDKHMTSNNTSKVRHLDKKPAVLVVSKDTGEILREVSKDRVKIAEEKIAKRCGNFVIGYQDDVLTMLGVSTALTRNQFRVLMFLYGTCDFDNRISVKNKDIADALDMQCTEVSKHLKRLKELSFVYGVSKTHGSEMFLCEKPFYKGTVTQLKKAVKRAEQAILSSEEAKQ